MFTLSNPHVLQASASTASVVNATASVDSITTGVDSFDGATPVSLGTSTTAIVAPASGTQSLIKALLFFNTSVSAQTLKVYYPTSTNQVYQGIIPASGSITWTPDDGWKVYDSTGLEQKLNLKSDPLTITTSAGPYPLTFAPDGRLLIATLGATAVPLSQYTISASSITFTGQAATAIASGAFSVGSLSYSY